MAFDIQSLLIQSGALLDGHFRLTSGKHSDRYIEKFRLIEQPKALDEVAHAIAASVNSQDINVVLGAAVGGILLAGAVARILGCRTMFTERVDGVMTLRRGFALSSHDQVLVVEDIVTTGGSVFELMKVVQTAGAQLRAVICIVDRSKDGVDFGVAGGPLLRMPIPAWEPEDCPLCKQNLPLMQPGRSGKQ
ncbi:MAG: orotate phosphoribosyltransferase [Fidelibacterota bacterium]|nr:MAG: orotate phosphoribosyltransferase [Candidatus Neomarinimicrobiota bacterium]